MSNKTKKNGNHKGKQTYKCSNCKKSFQNSKRKTFNKKLWKEYSLGKQTYKQLSSSHSKDIRTIQSKIDQYTLPQFFPKPREVVLVLDTTYFKRTFGVMVFRDVLLKENIFWNFVEYETISLYIEGIKKLEEKGFKILGITIDGRRGFKAFKFPVQMCQFHQKQIVKRYITGSPKLQAGIELKEIVDRLTITDKASFEYWITKWFNRWKEFLNEKTVNTATGKKQYMHRNLRSAYNSLKSNLDYLFTYEDYPQIPNTTNSLDGSFAHLKDKVRLHRGLKLDRKKKLIDQLLRKM